MKIRPRNIELQHLEFNQLKNFVAQLLAARNFDCPNNFFEGVSSDILRSVAESIRQEAESPRNLNARTLPLDGYLRRLMREAVRQCPKRYEKHIYNLSVEELEQVRKNVGGFVKETKLVDCRRCGKKTNHVCNGSHADEENLSDAPECLSLINTIFDSCLRSAERYYKNYSRKGPKTLSADVFFRTRIAVGSDTTGTTCFPSSDKSKSREAIVTIGLPIFDFDMRNYLRIMYIVNHEIFVHVPQAMSTSGIRTSYDDDCLFTEGFVDGAAMHCLERRLARANGLPQPLEEHRSAFLDEARKRHNERRDYRAIPFLVRDKQQRAKRKIRRARADGFHLFELLSKEGRLASEDRNTWHCKLALSLNVDICHPETRGAFARELLRNMRLPPLHPHRSLRLRALRRYLRDSRIKSLLGSFRLTDDKKSAT